MFINIVHCWTLLTWCIFIWICFCWFGNVWWCGYSFGTCICHVYTCSMFVFLLAKVALVMFYSKHNHDNIRYIPHRIFDPCGNHKTATVCVHSQSDLRHAWVEFNACLLKFWRFSVLTILCFFILSRFYHYFRGDS